MVAHALTTMNYLRKYIRPVEMNLVWKEKYDGAKGHDLNYPTAEKHLNNFFNNWKKTSMMHTDPSA